MKTELSSSGIVKLAWLTLLLVGRCDAKIPAPPPPVQIEVERILDDDDDAAAAAVETQ